MIDLPDYRPIDTLRLYDAHVAYGFDMGFPLSHEYDQSLTRVYGSDLVKLCRALGIETHRWYESTWVNGKETSFRVGMEDVNLDLHDEPGDWPGNLAGTVKEVAGRVVAPHQLELRLSVEWNDNPGQIAVYEFTYCGAFGVQWSTEEP